MIMQHEDLLPDKLENAKQWAIDQDQADELRDFRSRFHIPSKADLKSKLLVGEEEVEQPSDQCIYLCGNSLGVQPKSTSEYIKVVLTQWRTKGVLGHFVDHENSPLPPFLNFDDHGARLMAPIVGAEEQEVAMMGTLTGNLHLLMSSFYRPKKNSSGRYKILLEGKAFPSDHFAVESQITLAGYDPKDAMVLLEPQNPESRLLSTEQILHTIDAEADQLALILLPAIQFYTGQYFDIETITAHAHSHGIPIGWDCAHAAGNVELQLHDWNVDFAAWCTYKYLNSGPGATAGIFVHEMHGSVENSEGRLLYRPRLTGWWGDDKSTRFQMTNKFVPRPGAAGFQLSNPSALDMSAVIASLQIFNEATMVKLRHKSIRLTAFLEYLLTGAEHSSNENPYTIISPKNSAARGAQLSIRLQPGIMDKVLKVLEKNSVVIDERKPDVIRVAPAPLYNSFLDVFTFYRIFSQAVAGV